MMINDQYSEAQGNLRLSLEGEGDTEIFRRDLPFAIPELGQQTYKFDVVIPDAPGKCMLRAAAYRKGEEQQGPTLSRRKVSIVTKA